MILDKWGKSILTSFLNNPYFWRSKSSLVERCNPGGSKMLKEIQEDQKMNKNWSSKMLLKVTSLHRDRREISNEIWMGSNEVRMRKLWSFKVWKNKQNGGATWQAHRLPCGHMYRSQDDVKKMTWKHKRLPCVTQIWNFWGSSWTNKNVSHVICIDDVAWPYNTISRWSDVEVESTINSRTLRWKWSSSDMAECWCNHVTLLLVDQLESAMWQSLIGQ